VLVMSMANIGAAADEKVLYDFEKGLGGWSIPEWALKQADQVAKGAITSDAFASSGTHSMEVVADFPGSIWTGAYVEIMEYLDISDYEELLVDVYIPEDAPEGLKARAIFTAGENWSFLEMKKAVALIPGQWRTVRADLDGGGRVWKNSASAPNMASDVRKVGVRVESNQKPTYKGPFYIDNIRAANPEAAEVSVE